MCARRRRRQPDRPARPVAVGVAGPPPYSTRSRRRECLVECRIVTALPLDPAPVRQVGYDARVLPVTRKSFPVVLGGKSEPLDVGRALRTVPLAIRRALVAQDRGCAFPGCDRPREYVRHTIAGTGSLMVTPVSTTRPIARCTFRPHGLPRTRPSGTSASIWGVDRCWASVEPYGVDYPHSRRVLGADRRVPVEDRHPGQSCDDPAATLVCR